VARGGVKEARQGEGGRKEGKEHGARQRAARDERVECGEWGILVGSAYVSGLGSAAAAVHCATTGSGRRRENLLGGNGGLSGHVWSESSDQATWRHPSCSFPPLLLQP
jgi:hypothetical protein